MADNGFASGYRDNPELTRYVDTSRYENPKEDFKHIARKLAELRGDAQALSVADVGCGNGELLYYLSKLFPSWSLHGFDYAQAFIDTGKSFPGLASASLKQSDLFDVEGEYDVVIATCFLSLFRDFEPPLAKLCALCRPGGLVIGTGLFNPHDIEVRVEFCDNSRPETAGRWRTDFNRHSQRSIRDLLNGKASAVEFEPCRYDHLDLAADPAHPIRVWSMRDVNGDTHLVNGAFQFANQTLMIVHK